jgi:hypothetical protein
MNITRLAQVPVIVVAGLAPVVAKAQAATIKDCLPVLTKDYYKYAMKYNLGIDYLKSIDKEDWEEWQRSNDSSWTGSYAGANISLTDNYQEFDKKRSTYLETVHYNRTEQEALDIMQLTTAPRAYEAYEKCITSVDYGSPLRVWAASEDMDKIQLRVRYVNPPSRSRITMIGIVDGGSVTGAPAGRLWTGNKLWGVNQEFSFEIKRAAGASTTSVTVSPNDGSSPVRMDWKRADAALTLSYVGTTDVLRHQNMIAGDNTPNNNEKRSGCVRESGRHDQYCQSRTTVVLQTSAPQFFQNARGNYSRDKCPWCYATDPSISADGLIAQFFIDNWGSPVPIVLTADLYERLSSSQCGLDTTIPVVFKQAVVMTVLTECKPIATLKWKLLTGTQSEGTLKFGDQSDTSGKVVRDSWTDNGTALLGAYRVDN